MSFTAFQQSAFLQSLGWAIAHSVWQAGIFWALYHIVVSSYSSASAKFKNSVSTVFLFGSFLWFIATFLNKFIYLHKGIPETVPKQPAFSADLYFVSGKFSLQNFIHAVGITLPYLSAAYLLLLLVFTAKLINSYGNTIFIRYNGLQKPSAEWRLFVENVAGHINITYKIKLWFSKHVDVPATIGFFKPVILIPVASLNQLTTDQLEAIILHELSHIKRNDYLINLFISLIETILFFNPFIVLLSKIIKKERENCCDDFVLQYQYDRHSYASALLSLEKYRVQNLHLALTATSGKKQLLSRIKRIMEVKNKTNNNLNYGQKLIALLLITGIIGSVAWLTPQKKSRQSLHNHEQLYKKNLSVKPKMDEEKMVLKSKDAVTALLFPKLIKEKPVILTGIPEKISALPKKDQPLFTWKVTEEIEKNLHLQDLYNRSSAGIYPTIPHIPSFEQEHNLSFLSKFSLPDMNFFKNLNFYLSVDKLEAEIEKSNESFSSINWDIVEKEIIQSLREIKLNSLKIGFEKNKITSRIDKWEKDPKKNIANDFQLSFISDSKDNIAGWNIKISLGDSLFQKDINLSNKDQNRIFYMPAGENNSPATLPQKIRTRRIKISHDDLNHSSANAADILTKIYLDCNEKPVKQAIYIDYKNGSVLINDKKTPSSKSKVEKYLAAAVGEKVVLDCNKQIIEIETEDL